MDGSEKKLSFFSLSQAKKHNFSFFDLLFYSLWIFIIYLLRPKSNKNKSTNTKHKHIPIFLHKRKEKGEERNEKKKS